MSGPKYSRVRTGSRRLARLRLQPVVKRLESLPGLGGRTADDERLARELEDATASLRNQLARFETTGARRDESLRSLASAEQFLAVLAQSLREHPSSAEIRRLLSEMSDATSVNTETGIAELRAVGETLVARASRLDSLRKQASTVLESIRSARSAAVDAPRGTMAPALPTTDTVAIALRGSIAMEASQRDSLARDATLLGGFRAEDHSSLLQRASAAVDDGDHSAATSALDGARVHRESALLAAGEVRARIEARDELAAALCATLANRHYDECEVYLDGEGDSETRRLVVYAHNPSGKAHVRVTLELDGAMKVEIDGVGHGEEQTCIDILTSFRTTVAAQGDEMTIDDLGRASVIEETERIRHRTRGRQE